MTDSSGAPAEGWYPDPSGTGGYRFWNGAVWTEHLATDPAGSTAPMRPVTDEDIERPASAAGRERMWNGGTWTVLAACTVVVVAVSVLTGWHLSSRAAAQPVSAEVVLVAFLEDATSGDDGWKQSVTPGMRQTADGTFAPLYGDYGTGESLQLDVSYEVDADSFLYSSDGWDSTPVDEHEASAMSARVTFEYQFTLADQKYTAEIVQLVWVTRPFYYGDDEPSVPAPSHGTPTAVGPWKVTAIGSDTRSWDLADDVATTDVTSPAFEDDDLICRQANLILTKMSERARQRGKLGSGCLFGDGELRVRADDVDPDAVAAGFPVLTFNSPLSNELIGLRRTQGQTTPLQQYTIDSGDKRFVFTLVAANRTAGEISESPLRLFWLEEVKAR